MCVCACVCECVSVFICACILSHSGMSDCATPCTIGHQVPLSMYSPSKNIAGLPFPPPKDLPKPGIELLSPAPAHWLADSLPLSHLGSPTPALVLKSSGIPKTVLLQPIRSVRTTGAADLKIHSISPGGSGDKEFTYNADLASILWLGRSPEEGNGNPLLYSCLENSMTEESMVNGVANCHTRLSD